MSKRFLFQNMNYQILGLNCKNDPTILLHIQEKHFLLLSQYRMFLPSSNTSRKSVARNRNGSFDTVCHESNSFQNLPKFENHGEPIEYRVEEDPVEDYEEPEIIPVSEYESIIVNTHNKTTISIHIVKNWNDNNDEYGLRPESITVDIYKNNELYESVELSAETNWEYTIDGLDKYLNGEEITYSIKERPVDQYTVSYDNYNITNKVIEPEEEIEITPPDTGIKAEPNNNYLYYIIAIISTLSFGFYKVFE